MDENEIIYINGTVEAIVFHNEDNGYAVLRLFTEEEEEITATGCMPQIGVGEELSLAGKWITHASYGEQFAVDYFERRLPETAKGMVAFLSSGAVKGIGPKLAKKIVDKFKEETFNIILKFPERLTEIRGITDKKALEFQQQFQRQNYIKQVMEFLMENGLPIELAPRLYYRLKERAIEALENNPYLLCDEYYDVDFNAADKLALGLGFLRTSSERISAGVIFTLRFNLQNGHTFIPMEKLVAATKALLQEDDDEPMEDSLIEDEIMSLKLSGHLICEHICDKDAVYLKQIYSAEQYIADYFGELSKREFEYQFDISDLVTALEDDSEINYAPLQRQAIEWAAKYGLVILTGGPGTGKTTTVKGMIKVFESLGLNVVLAAPTGRAAKRLSELCGMEAKTIHRLLEAGYSSGESRLTFQRGRENPIETDVVILDEVSMVDITLMQALIEALPNDTRLILVGDADQLPPVGPGNLLRDIIGAHCIATVELNEIFRQAQKSAIVTNAHAINAGEMPAPSGKDGDFFIIKKSAPADVISTIVELCKERLPSYYGLKPSQIQVLTPSRRQGAGTHQLNRMLQEALNPPSENKAEKRFGDTIFRIADRVMQVRNNYDIVWERENDPSETGSGMFNGDVGEILQIDVSMESMLIRFDDKIAHYSFDMLNELELAYAMTVHKSQGSEFDAVILALSSGISKRLLTRNILYTAITRAKSLLVLVGSSETTQYMVQTNTRNKRYSALKARLLRKETE